MEELEKVNQDKKTTVVAVADDISLVGPPNSVFKLNKKLIEVMPRNFTLRPEKTEALVTDQNILSDQQKQYLSDKKIPIVSTTKYLGVQMGRFDISEDEISNKILEKP